MPVDGDGKMLNGIVQKADIMPTAGITPMVQHGQQQDFYVVEERINIPIKAAWLRFAVRDTATDRIGAMEISLPLLPEKSN
jgi:hypothetical protein